MRKLLERDEAERARRAENPLLRRLDALRELVARADAIAMTWNPSQPGTEFGRVRAELRAAWGMLDELEQWLRGPE